MSFETDLKRLEEITAELKDENTGLEKAIELYEEAAKLTKSLNKTLSTLERKIEKVTSEDEFELEMPCIGPYATAVAVVVDVFREENGGGIARAERLDLL